ncbi:MAG TPA: hypothetical protein VJL80_06390 [Aeromicrobium sp.]|nr:hypothetical protein [Aeromicrobium sp.]HKY57647.1 hypothetical protein [Aeromicrobium sp.]
MPLYGVHLIVAALANVPSRGYDVARRNGVLVFKRNPGVAVFSETWDAAVKRALRNAAPESFRWFTARGQSVMVGWDARRYELVWKRRIKGGASPRIPRVTDRRDLFVVCLRDRETSRCFVVVGVHTSPIPTRKAPDMVDVARRTHEQAGDNIEQVAETTGYPVIAAGDFNTPHLVKPSRRVGPGIVHAELFPGQYARWGEADAANFALRSDHSGLAVTLEVVKR